MAPKVIDLEDIVINWAWNTFLRTRGKDHKTLRFEDLKFDVVWDRVRFLSGIPEYSDPQKLTRPHSQVVFKSVYENKTDHFQEHAFHTERSTVSCCSTTITKGFTKGIRLELKLGLPEEVASATAGFGREVTMETADESTHEEIVGWSINSTIKVPPKHRTVAELVVKEQEYTANFKMTARIRGHMVVMITNLRDNNAFVQCMESDFCELIRNEGEQNSKRFTIDGKTVYWEVFGNCKFRYGIEQHVQLYEHPLQEVGLGEAD